MSAQRSLWWRLRRAAGTWGDPRPGLFWASIAILAGVRLLLAMDLGAPLVDNSYDLTLYIKRAYFLLHGEGLGPYDALMLDKLPGISFWIAWVRWLGIPLVLSLSLAHVLSGAYLILALRRARVWMPALLLAYAAYALNLFTWQSPFELREQLDTSLLVLMLGAMSFLWHGLQFRHLPVVHLLVFSAALSFALLLREEGVMYYALLALLGGIGAWLRWRSHGWRRWAARGAVVMLLLVPLLVAQIGNLWARSFVREHYGVGLLYDLNEGEFPRFIAALRGVRSSARTRYVSLPREMRDRVAKVVPDLAPVFAGILPAPGPDSWIHHNYSQFRGLIDDWPNSHIYFWIKTAAQDAGRTPNLPEAQAYFRQARLEIEAACSSGALACAPDGSGLWPAFKMGYLGFWLSEFVSDARQVVTIPARLPKVTIPTLAPGPRAAAVRLGNQTAAATLTPFDNLAQWHLDPAAPTPGEGLGAPQFFVRNLEYWLRYPDVAQSPEVGLRRHLAPEAMAPLRKALGAAKIVLSRAPLRTLSAQQQDKLKRIGLLDEHDGPRGWNNAPMDLYLMLRWLLAHPALKPGLVPAPAFGQAEFGAFVHYQQNGRREGRTFFQPADGVYEPQGMGLWEPSSVLASFRLSLVQLGAVFQGVILLGLGLFVLRRVLLWRKSPQGLELLLGAFLLFSGVKLAGLSYVAVFMGPNDLRLFFSTYAVLVLLCSALVVQTLRDILEAIATRLPFAGIRRR